MINYWAVLVCSLIAYVIGMLWYSPALFGKEWMRLSKIKEGKPTVGIMVGGFLITVVLVLVLAWFISTYEASTFAAGAALGFLLWIGFIGTIALNGVFYQKMPWALYLINTVHYLLVLLVVGGILAVW